MRVRLLKPLLQALGMKVPHGVVSEGHRNCAAITESVLHAPDQQGQQACRGGVGHSSLRSFGRGTQKTKRLRGSIL
jgi:hypothetical protein